MKKKSSNIFYNVKKKTCLDVLDQGKRGDDNEKGLKEGDVIKIKTTVQGGVIKIETTVLHYTMLAPFACIPYLQNYHFHHFSLEYYDHLKLIQHHR